MCVPAPLVGPAVWACSGFGSWCCSRLDARLVLLVCCCLRRRTAGVVGCWLSVVFAWPGLVLCWCVAPSLLGRAVFVHAPPHGGACCVGVCPPPWWGVLRWFVALLMAGRAVFVRGPPLGGACCVGACPPQWWCLAWVVVVCWMDCGCGCVVCLAGAGAVLVRAPPPCSGVPCLCVAPPWWSVLFRRAWVLVRGVVAGSMLGLFCWFAVVPAAVWPALLGVGCLWCLPGWGWCCAGVCPPPPPCWGVLCLCVASPMVGVLCWCVPPPMVGRAALVCCRPLGGVCCVGACPSRWWCLAGVVVVCWVGCRCGSVACLASAGAVLVRAPPPSCWGEPCLCVAPPLVGRAVSACSGLGSWCCSRLDARLVLLVRCCLRRRTAGVVGCWLSVVFAWPGQTGRPPERVWCATPLSWPGRTGRPPGRVRCTNPCFCFANIVALPRVFPCSPSAFSCLRGSWPCAGVCHRLLPHPPTPPYPTTPLRFLSSAPPLLLGVPRPPAVVPPPGGFWFRGRWRPAPRLPLLPLCLVVTLRRLAVCQRLLLSRSPPPPPGFVVRGWRCPAARFPVSSCCCLVFFVPLALAPVWLGFFFPPQLAAFRALCALCAGAVPPPPPRGCS